jgi:lysophospholipase L1-like esterase
VFPLNLNYYKLENNHIPDKGDRKRVVLFGDSRIEQWSPLPDIKNAQFINRGISGETTSQMIARYQQDVISLSPDIIVIQAGINDLVAAGLYPKKAKRISQSMMGNLIVMIEQGNNINALVILMSVVRPSNPPWYRQIVWSSDIEKLVNDVNMSIHQLQMKYSVKIMDADKILHNDSNVFAEQYAIDTLHFNRSAYDIMNMALIDIIE